MMHLLRRVLEQLSVLALACKFVLGRGGRANGVGRWAKLRLVVRLVRNHARIPNLTTLQQQLVMVRDIVATPRSVEGDVVECGCFEGGSTIGLSLACALVGRRLFVCDTFTGLPRPQEGEAVDVHAALGVYHHWQEGDFRGRGGLEGVRENVRRYGELDVCRFVEGLYRDTLPSLDTNAIILVYEDADLASSVEDCIEFLWPKLQTGCRFYCQEPFSISVVGLFYDRVWWRERMDSTPPGFFGSGGGVDFVLKGSGLGFAIKFDPESVQATGRRIGFKEAGRLVDDPSGGGRATPAAARIVDESS